MIEIPENDKGTELELKAKSEHEAELDSIAKRVLDLLKERESVEICCSTHAVGLSSNCRNLSDTLEVAKAFAEKGYYCYWRQYCNNHGVEQREVIFSKGPMCDSELNGRHPYRRV